MKDVELKLLIELMKNSRRSDRELARVIGISQPTVSRMIKKLEKEGYIREYTIIPDFSKLGFQMMTIFLAKLKARYPQESVEQTRAKVRQTYSQNPSPTLMAMNGLGVDADRIIITLSKDYSIYGDSIRHLRQHPLVDVENVNSFLIDLSDCTHFLPFTLTNLAKNLDKSLKSQKSEA